MAYQGIFTGTNPNDNTGDSLLEGAIKINSNFEEIYNALGDGTTINAIIEPDGIDTGSIVATGLIVNGDVDLGIGSTNTISAIGRFDTNLVPATNEQLDLGTSNFKWGQVYAQSFSGDGANLTSLNANNLTSGTVSASRLGTGSAITSKFLRGDNTWQAISIDTSNFVTTSTLSDYATTSSLSAYLKKDNGGTVSKLSELGLGNGNNLILKSNRTNCTITYSGSDAIIIDGKGSNGIYLFNNGLVTAYFKNNDIILNENTRVNGTFSANSKAFKISHPLPEKSETHNLIHSSIEGPQADNIYRGKINLINGTASVNIDTVAKMTEGTFVALNREVQCFTTNETGWTAIKGSVSGNILTITAQDNTCTDIISWLVIGERQDQDIYNSDSTDENGKLIVEIEKISGEDDPLFNLNLEES